MAVNISGYLAKSGKVIYLFATDSVTGQCAQVTAVPGPQPTFTVGGTAVNIYPTAAAGTIAIWCASSGAGSTPFPFVGFQVTGPVTLPIAPGTAIAYSATAGWLTTSSGSAPAATNATLLNSSGVDEPGMGGVKGFALLPADKTIQIGFCTGWYPGSSSVPMNVHKNYVYKLMTPWSVTSGSVTMGDGVSAPFGQPVSWSVGQSVSQGFSPSETEIMPSSYYPMGLNSSPGTNNSWVIIWDDTVPGNMSFWISSNAAGTTGVDSGSYSGTQSSSVTTGTTTTTTTISYPGTSASPGIKRPISGDPAQKLRLNAKAANNTWTAQNLWLISPGNVPTRTAAYAGDDIFSKYITAPNGNTCKWLRMHIGAWFFGQGNAVDPGDIRSTTDFTWNGSRQGSVAITGIRYYNTTTANGPTGSGKYAWVSNRIYSSTYGYSGTDSIGPYITSGEGDDGYAMCQSQGTNSYVAAEFTTSTNLQSAGLKTGMCPVFPGGLTALPITDDNGVTSTVVISGLNSATNYIPCWVTGANSFMMGWYRQGGGIPGGTSPNFLKVQGTTVWPYNFNVTWSIPDGGYCSPEHYAGAALSAGAHLWLVLPFFMSDAGCLSYFNRCKNVGLAPGRKVLVELGCETWGTYFQGWTGGTTMGQLQKYLPTGTALGPLTAGTTVYYNTTAGQVVSRDQFLAIRQGQLNDMLASVFGETNIVRIMAAQWGNGSISANGRMKCAGNATNITLNQSIPLGALSVAAYFETGFGNPKALWCDPATTANAGVASVDLINEWYRHEVKYDNQMWLAAQYAYNLCQAYTGPVNNLVGGVAINNGIGKPMAPTDKPQLIGYEASMSQATPGAVTDYTSILQDVFYHPSFADCYTAYFRAMQDGHPYVPGSGFSAVTLHEIGGGWGGQGGNKMFAQVVSIGQMPAPATGTTDPTQAGYMGITPVSPQYVTPQGGSPGDGAGHTITNSLPGLYSVQQWMSVANDPSPYAETGTPAPLDARNHARWG